MKRRWLQYGLSWPLALSNIYRPINGNHAASWISERLFWEWRQEYTIYFIELTAAEMRLISETMKSGGLSYLPRNDRRQREQWDGAISTILIWSMARSTILGSTWASYRGSAIDDDACFKLRWRVKYSWSSTMKKSAYGHEKFASSMINGRKWEKQAHRAHLASTSLMEKALNSQKHNGSCLKRCEIINAEFDIRKQLRRENN